MIILTIGRLGGEVVEGMDVVDRVELVEGNRCGREGVGERRCREATQDHGQVPNPKP
jgi:hypothetical protein